MRPGSRDRRRPRGGCATSARAVRRSRRESPDPSTMRTPATGTPATRSSSRTTRAPAALEPIPSTLAPSSLRSISDTKLSLSRFILLTIATSGSERSWASGRPFAGARPVVIRPATVTPRRASASLNERAAAPAEPFGPARSRSSTESAESGGDSRPRKDGFQPGASRLESKWRSSATTWPEIRRMPQAATSRARQPQIPVPQRRDRRGRRGRGFPARRDPGAVPCRRPRSGTGSPGRGAASAANETASFSAEAGRERASGIRLVDGCAGAQVDGERRRPVPGDARRGERARECPGQVRARGRGGAGVRRRNDGDERRRERGQASERKHSHACSGSGRWTVLGRVRNGLRRATFRGI